MSHRWNMLSNASGFISVLISSLRLIQIGGQKPQEHRPSSVRCYLDRELQQASMGSIGLKVKPM